MEEVFAQGVFAPVEAPVCPRQKKNKRDRGKASSVDASRMSLDDELDGFFGGSVTTTKTGGYGYRRP